MTEVFQEAKITKPEAMRIKSIEITVSMHNFRSDLTRNIDKVISDAKRIQQYLEDGI
jgi:hypothetical protein